MNYEENKNNNLIKLLKEKKQKLIDNDLQLTLTSDICKNCLQDSCCCNKYPCIFSPKDFIDITDLEYMKKIIDTGLICISNYKKNNLLIVRPVGKREICNNPNYNKNTCIFYHYKTGCMLDFNIRPTQGLLFIPQDNTCIDLYSSDEIEKEYKPYQDILKELYYYQKSVNVDLRLFDVSNNKIKQLVKRITENSLQN